MSYILLVEDNQANADMVIRVLSSVGLEVKHFIRGLDAARAARQSRPNLILMDFDLPDIDGRSLILTLKKQLGNNVAPPIVAVTGRTADVEKELARRFGCSAFICKPFLPEDLLKVVLQLLEKENTKTKTI